ncbi:hypothetical protein [Syntrophorhabdus aromaticivorans]|jgi:hypothetical protein|uniref:Uncharacterized protein n=1 Tax=Syntrophorhabdus aromaticivorans TaxID=328301 RepID=A0A351U7F0_9BACT|nr:hypothetical protein [Syntrophorhabdus aromaticivorans]NLW36452.1 hypothetical protein [Syntrophorhabdus aromaticivorans]HBA55881.1 hypothetical protein [Syntrophorhabdus aromaticivorans]
MEINEKLMRDLKKKVDLEMSKNEIEIVEHWRKEIEVIYKKRYENLGSLQIDLKNLMDRMSNRAAILSRMVKEYS